MKILKIAILTSTLFVGACSHSTPAQQPSDTAATAPTATLYNRLFELRTQGTMIGHQDAFAYGVGWYADDLRCDFRDATGVYPAIFGWEIGELEIGAEYSLDSVNFDRLREYIRRADAVGGINTISWHARNPLTGGDAWDVSSPQTVPSVLVGGDRHEAYLKGLDHLASLFLSLKDDRGTLIPVIFRPYHEMTGDWFWWGAPHTSAADYVALWQMTADYLQQKGVHNLLWAYSASGFTSDEEFLAYYPGDRYADLIGFDAYQQPDDVKGTVYQADVSRRIDRLLALATTHHKIPILAETGYETIPDSTWFSRVLNPLLEGRGLSYVLLWRNAYNRPNHFYAAYPGHAAAADMQQFTARCDILTADKIKQ
ncbi:MAG: glycosyl hydrolase [Alistipes sp.]